MTQKEKLKTGFTTGTCAQAAAKAACLMLVTKKILKNINVETPKGIRLNLEVIDQEIGGDFARCAVVKDAGSDPDVTNGAKINAEVRYSDKKGISIIGGEGVGIVTKLGLAVNVGEHAINPTPRQMIIKELSVFAPQNKGIHVIITVPDGQKIAESTFNPRIGITGGISIIGTTGIVEPRSTDAYKTSLSLQLDVLKAAGNKKAVLVLGYVGENFYSNLRGKDDNLLIKIGDHIGFMLNECVKKKIGEVYLIGHIGKLIKLAGGQLNTHNRFGDNRIDLLAGYAETYGAKREVIEDILRQTTAEAVSDILKTNGLTEIFSDIAKKVTASVDGLKINCAVLSLKGEVLGCHPKNCLSLV